MRTNKLLVSSVVVMSLLFVTCKDREIILPKKSKDKTITKASIVNPPTEMNIDGTKITATVPFGTNLTALTLDITYSKGASIAPNPKIAQDFSDGKSVTYTVTAENKSTQDYTVSITAKEQTQFVVSFNSDGGNTIASTKVKKGEKATTPDKPIRQGYKFKEWQLDDKTFDFNNTPMTKDITLKAIWIEALKASYTDWIVEDVTGGVKILSYKGTPPATVVIPTTINNKRVIAIENYSYEYNIFPGKSSNIISIDFTKAIYLTSIGNYTFYDCTALTSITIPDAVTSIGGFAFARCTSLTSVKIPDAVTSIGGFAFTRCTSLTSVKIPDAVTSIGDAAFASCTSLTSIRLPESLTSIGNFVFQYCTSLTSINIPDTVTSIGDGAFASCTSLTSVKIPDAVTSIGRFAFARCTSLTSVKIPDAVTSIGDTTFYNCTSLTSIRLPESLTSIGNFVFQYCSSLTSVKIPDAVTSIGNSAFSTCTSLASIRLPESLTSIGYEAFYDCTGLTSVRLHESVTSIGNSAFSNCISLTSITIPDAVTSIGNSAFSNCISLTSITIPDAVTSIGIKAFFKTKITKVTLPKSCTYKADSFDDTVTITYRNK